MQVIYKSESDPLEGQLYQHYAAGGVVYRDAWRRLRLRMKIKAWSAAHFSFVLGKRALDVLVALGLLLALLPFFGLLALLIRLESPGKIFFSQWRVGRHGRRFRMYKFRSMGIDAEAEQSRLSEKNETAGITFKIREDPRITRVGRVIRKLSVDELPQLWNILRGEMTLVGPRPPVPDETALYSAHERRRLSVTPGLTCLWQVGGRSDIDFAGQVRLDLDYIRERSFTRDLGILLRTIPAVISGRGAY